MNPLCLLGLHSAAPSNVRNLGLRISLCRCCGCDMIHKRGRWTNVPPGFRIVWRRLDEVIAEAVPLRVVRNLPVLSRNAPGRDVFGLGGRAMEIADLIRSAIRVVAWSTAERWRLFQLSMIDPFRPRQFVLPL